MEQTASPLLPNHTQLKDAFSGAFPSGLSPPSPSSPWDLSRKSNTHGATEAPKALSQGADSAGGVVRRGYGSTVPRLRVPSGRATVDICISDMSSRCSRRYLSPPVADRAPLSDFCLALFFTVGIFHFFLVIKTTKKNKIPIKYKTELVWVGFFFFPLVDNKAGMWLAGSLRCSLPGDVEGERGRGSRNY